MKFKGQGEKVRELIYDPEFIKLRQGLLGAFQVKGCSVVEVVGFLVAEIYGAFASDEMRERLGGREWHRAAGDLIHDMVDELSKLTVEEASSLIIQEWTPGNHTRGEA